MRRPLYTSFGCPWADVPLAKEPVFSVPQCYTTVNAGAAAKV